MELLGYLGAVGMGVTLGLIGGGGSILAVPILVYLFRIPGAAATYDSLFIVGVCAAAGAIPFAKRGLVNFRTALLFFFPSVAGVMLSRRLLLPAVPIQFRIAGISFSKDLLILSTFSAVMIAAALSMLRKSSSATRGEPTPARTALNGIGVGAITGFVGAGGGFLIVPALVNGLGLPMERAIGTSLTVIALNSLSGFTIDWMSGYPAHWELILRFAAASLAGILIGTRLGRRVPSQKLKPAFGWFVLILGSLIILKQGFELQFS